MNDTNKDVKPLYMIIQLAGIILLFLTAGLGLLFMQKGNTIYTGILTIVGILALYLCVAALWKIKVNRRFEGFDFRVFGLVSLYIVVAVFSYIAIFHGYNVQINSQQELVNLGVNLGKEIKQDLPDAYEEKAEADIASYKLDQENKEVDESVIASNIKAIKGSLEVALSEADKTLTDRSISNITTWNIPALHQSFYDLDKILLEQIDRQKAAFTKPKNEEWQGNTFDYNRKYIAGNIISSPSELSAKYSVDYIIPFIIWLFCHALILLPYFVSNAGKKFVRPKTYYENK